MVMAGGGSSREGLIFAWNMLGMTPRLTVLIQNRTNTKAPEL
jgi:hypothetical protein